MNYGLSNESKQLIFGGILTAQQLLKVEMFEGLTPRPAGLGVDWAETRQL